MGKFVPKTYDQLLQRMIDRLVARSDLDDVADPSNVLAALKAFARELADGHFQVRNLLDLFDMDRCEGDDLDARLEDFPTALARKTAVAATGAVQFTRAVSGPIVVPSGTLVEVPGADPAIVAVTTANVNVVGTTSGDVPATMQTTGTIGNVGANALTKFKGARPAGVDAVSNSAPFTGGIDRETDDALRARVKAYVSTLSRGTPFALETAALGVVLATGQRIVFARIAEDPITLGKSYLYVDDGTGAVEKTTDNYAGGGELLTTGPDFPGDVAQGGEIYLYSTRIPIKDSLTLTLTKNPGAIALIRNDPGANGYTLNPANGQIRLNTALVAGDSVLFKSTEIIGIMKEVQKVIDGSAADRVNYPGYRAAGTLVIVKAPGTQQITVEADVTVREGFDAATVIANVENAIIAYINGLGIGNDVVRSEIIERAMAVDGMYDIALTAPTANVSILEDVLPRTNSAIVTIT